MIAYNSSHAINNFGGWGTPQTLNPEPRDRLVAVRSIISEGWGLPEAQTLNPKPRRPWEWGLGLSLRVHVPNN